MTASPAPVPRPEASSKLLRRVLAERGLLGETRFGVPLASLTSLGLGGPAAALVETDDPDKLELLLADLEKYSIPWRVLGGGSNLLVDDRGVPGAVIRLLGSPPELIEGNRIRAGGGTFLQKVVATAGGAGLGGLEFCAGIPGTVGGAVAMNAGTGQQWLSSVLEAVTIIRPGQGREELAPAECGFDYRRSRFRREAVAIVSARFRLRPSSRQAVEEKIQRQMRRRARPESTRCAGCWFRNPPGDSAGRLIEAAGLKGLTRGGAKVSREHANFIIVTETGTSSREVRGLADYVRAEVKAVSGIDLQEEIVGWG